MFFVQFDQFVSISVNVKSHISSPDHVATLHVKHETDSLNKSLASAIVDGIFQQIIDGLVKCTACDLALNDSLTNLKKHMLSEQHKFAATRVIVCVDNTRTIAKVPVPVGKKLVSLVSSNVDLEFAISDDGQPKVRCIKCDKLLPREHNDLMKHLHAKKHTKEARKKRSPNQNRKRPPENSAEPREIEESEDSLHIVLESELRGSPESPNRKQAKIDYSDHDS